MEGSLIQLRIGDCMEKPRYTMILADDEEEVRRRIASKIPANSRFDLIGFAENGYDALDLVERLHPDVVLTDIRMPFIDGLELAKRLRIEYPTTKVAFISGFDEFSYAKKAIELDVVSYLTKPVTEAEIVVFLDRLEKRLDEEREQYTNQAKLDQLFESNLPAMIEHQFNALLRLPEITHADLEKFQVYGIDLTQGKFLLGVIEIEDNEDFSMSERLRIFLMSLFEAKIPDRYRVRFFNSQYGFVFLVMSESIHHLDLESSLHEIILTKDSFSPLRVRIGVSETFDDFTLFPDSMLQAKKALSYGNYLHIGNLIFYKDITTRKKADLTLSREEIDEISYTVKFGSSKAIRSLFASLQRDHSLSEGYLMNKRYFIISLTNIFMDFAKGLSVELEPIVGGDLYDRLDRFDNLQDLFAFLEDISYRIRESNIEHSQSRANRILDEAVEFLEVHYPDPNISMDFVSDKLNVSISYLAMLFKKNLDTTFNRFLVKIRMEKAMEMLKYTNDKILNIATAVGYSDVYYFSFSFKKYTSKTPKEFRHEEQD